MKYGRSFARLIAVLGCCVSMSGPGTAAAQQATVDEQLAEVVVTGSRVITNGNNMPTPVTVVTAEDLSVTRPTTVFEGLINLPVFSGSAQAVGNPAGAGGSSRTQSGLNLRGLGTGRTLVLSGQGRTSTPGQRHRDDELRLPAGQRDPRVRLLRIPA